jgi:hypothetical protein
MEKLKWKSWLGYTLLALSVLYSLAYLFAPFSRPDGVWRSFWLEKPAGWQATFKWQYDAAGTSNSNPLAPQAGSTQIPALETAGVLTVTILETQRDEARLRFSLIIEKAQPASFVGLLVRSAPFEMEAIYGADGRLHKATLQPDSNPLVRSILREIAYDFQLSWSDSRNPERIEDQSVGKVQARLTQSQDRGKQGTLIYSPESGPEIFDRQAPRLSPHSAATKKWRSDQQGLYFLEVLGSWEFRVGEVELGSQQRKVQFERMMSANLGIDALQRLISQVPTEKLELDPLAEQKVLLKNMDKRLVANTDLRRLKQQIKALPDMAGDTDKDLYLILKAYLRLYPEQTSELCEEFLIEEAEDSRRFQIVLDALTYAGTEASQSLMMETIQSRTFEGKESLSILASLGLSPTGSKKVVEFLEETIRSQQDVDVFNTTILALGNASRVLASDDPSASRQTYETLKRGLTTATSDEAKRTYLAALGNLGHQDQIELAQEFIDGNSDVRTQIDAMRSLRFSANPAVPEYVLGVLERPTSKPDLQRAAVEVIQKRRLAPAELSRVQTIFWSLQDEAVLQQVLTLVRDQMEAEAARPFLTRVREEHFNSEVRKFARDIILLQQ